MLLCTFVLALRRAHFYCVVLCCQSDLPARCPLLLLLASNYYVQYYCNSLVTALSILSRRTFQPLQLFR